MINTAALAKGAISGLLLVRMFGAAATLSSRFYEDDRIRVAIPDGWVVKHETVTTSGDSAVQIPIGAVLSKGEFRIYLLTNKSQASGIVGGRFGEISAYVSPWMKVDDPWGCFGSLSTSMTPVNQNLERVDLYVDSKSADRPGDPQCTSAALGVKPGTEPAWFGSYFAKRGGGFFIPYPLEGKPNEEMVFAATMAVGDTGSLPRRDDRELARFLREASAIVASVQLK